jgi:predicted MFS family arabinose efflux permease
VTKRWLGVLVLMVIVGIAYMDRINVSLMIANSDFLHQFGLEGDRAAQGRLMTLFLIGYGLSAWLLTPFLEARMGIRGGLLASLLLWTAMTGASAMAASVAVFLAWRVLLGGSEGPLFSLKTMFVQDHFSPAEVGKPNAVTSLGINLGLAAGYPLLALLISQFGWRGSLWALALINLLVGVPLVILFVRAPQGARRAIPRPRASAAALFRAAASIPHLPLIMLIEICTLSYLWGASTWLPTYLSVTRHFSLGAMSLFAGLPFIAGMVASVAAGSLLDLMPARKAPIVFFIGGATTAASVTTALLVGNPYVAAAALVLAGASWAFQGPAIPTLVQHVAAPGSVGSAYGLINGIGNLFAALMPMFMGAAMASPSGESLTRGFWLLVGSELVTVGCGLMLLWRLNRRTGVAAVSVGAGLPTED